MSNKSVFESITKQIAEADDNFKKEFADEFEKRVKRRTPVDTGTLRRGWKVKVTSNSIDVKNDVPYAGYVEDGTEHMAGAHMLKTTVSETAAIAKKVTNG